MLGREDPVTGLLCLSAALLVSCCKLSDGAAQERGCVLVLFVPQYCINTAITATLSDAAKKRQSFTVTCQASTQERYTSPISYPGARKGVSATPRPLYPREREQVSSTPGCSDNNILSQSKLAQSGNAAHFC